MIIGRYLPPDRISAVGRPVKEWKPPRSESVATTADHRSLVSGLLEDYLENFNVIGGGCVRILGYRISATGRPHGRNSQSQEIKRLSKV